MTGMATTRKSLHGAAELLLAGPQYRQSSTIRLRPMPGGFGTVAEPAARIDGTDLVVGDVRVPLAGTYTEVATAAGLTPVPLSDLYPGGPGITPADTLAVDPASARIVADALATGDVALRQFAPAETPVLWPEHFDLGIAVDGVNYGVSPGDDLIAEPYAYVGPHQPRIGAFWNQPFGAARPLYELPGPAQLLAFYAEGRSRAADDPVAG